MFDPADYDNQPDLDTLRRDEEADRATERAHCPGGDQCRCVRLVNCRPKRRR